LQIEAPEESLAVLGPYLANPLVLLLALGVVAVVTPIVEEIAKSAPIWAVYDRLTDGSQGFWAGALSGAGFALFEGILVSSDAGTGIAAILVLRAGSSLMHIMASGFAGWGIAAFRATRSVKRLVAGYGAAMAAHALWNGSVVAIGYGGIRTTYGATQPDVFGVALSIIGAMTLAGLIGGLPIALVAINLKLRAKPQEPGPSASSPSVGSESTHPLEG
jgi:RsiW-degrading membrane proteinase PrsW (M82 family)